MDQITTEITHQNKAMENTLKKYYRYRQNNLVSSNHKTHNNSHANVNLSAVLTDASSIRLENNNSHNRPFKRDNSGTKVRTLLSEQKSLLNDLENIRRESVSISKSRNRRTYCMSSLATYSG